MSVRRSRPGDAAAIFQLARKLWPDCEQTDLDGEVFFVAEEKNGTLCGFACVRVRPYVDGAEGEPCPHLEGWFVEEGLRGKGIGRALVGAVETWCREQGFDELTSDALADNAQSIASHKAIGFAPTELLQLFRKDLKAS